MKRGPVPDGCPLTPRQFELLRRLGEDGLTYAQLGLELGVAMSTIRTHTHAAFSRLGVPGLAQAISLMGRRGWLGWTPPAPPQQVTSKLAATHPFLHAYVSELDKWLASGMRDSRARRGMKLALIGARNGVTTSS
jgi:DNA-binding CsgD family transcriptional regulator